MSTKYYCDCCNEEIFSPNQIQKVIHQYFRGNSNQSMKADLCKKCVDKILKPINYWQSTIKVNISFDETEEYYQ